MQLKKGSIDMKDLTDKKTTKDSVKLLIQEEYEFTSRYECLEKNYVSTKEKLDLYFINDREVDRFYFQEILAHEDAEYNQELIEVDDIIEALFGFK